MPVVIHQASLSLDFLVVGAGIGGLAVAYVLSTAGHRVRVVEKRDLNVPGGGHRVPPNLSKILRQWIGEQELMKVATRNVGTPFRRLRTDETVGYVRWKPAVLAETGGEFLLMHHGDLIQTLYKLATGAGAKIDFNTPVASIQPGTANNPRPSVVFVGGETVSVDLVIGADGCQSTVREVVLGEQDRPMPGGLTTYNGVIKAEDMLDDTELKELLEAEEWPLWMEGHRCFSSHPVRGKKEYSFGICSWHGLDGLEQGGQENWEELVPPDTALTETDGPILRKLLARSPHLIRTQYMTRAEVNSWVDSTGRIVLLGDAAHPSYPGGSHPASMAVEDAVVLGTLFSHLRTMDQAPSFLSAYQELRQRRTALVTAADLANAQLVVLPAGPDADARDANMHRLQDEWDEEGVLTAQFDEIREIFGYDAGDAAEEWWINWGRFHRTAQEHASHSRVNLSYSSVTVRSL